MLINLLFQFKSKYRSNNVQYPNGIKIMVQNTGTVCKRYFGTGTLSQGYQKYRR